MSRKDDADYTIRLGARLLALRRQQHLSLQDVEAASDQEFRASVLGAYGRGERAISVPRLQRLARCYRVPVDQMVPVDDEADIPPTGGDEHSVGRVAPSAARQSTAYPCPLTSAPSNSSAARRASCWPATCARSWCSEATTPCAPSAFGATT